MSLRIVALVLAAALLAGCGSGPVRRISPSAVSIQQLVVAADGSWRLTLRIQNYSTVSMHYSGLHGTLQIAGADAGSIDLNPDLDIPPNSADVVDATLRSSAKLPSGDIEYKLAGKIETSEPKNEFKFDRSSRLFPTPGLPGTWR